MKFGSISLLGSVLLAAGLSGCANSGIPGSHSTHGPIPATDCSTDLEPASFSSVYLPDERKRLIGSRVKQHYAASSVELITAEAARMLLSAESRFDGAATELGGIIYRFPQSEIPVFIHTANSENQALARTAIDKLNSVLREGTNTLLVEGKSEPGSSIGNKRGIHIYFGSNKCMWRVFREQMNKEKRSFSPRIQASFDRRATMTARLSERNNGRSTGRIRRSFAIIFNIQEPRLKQYGVEWALFRALGVKGRAQSVLWSRMSPVTIMRAPSEALPEFDRNMLRILYGQLRPGDSGTTTAIKLSRHWRKSDALSDSSWDKCINEVVRRQTDGANVRNLELLNELLC